MVLFGGGRKQNNFLGGNCHPLSRLPWLRPYREARASAEKFLGGGRGSRKKTEK